MKRMSRDTCMRAFLKEWWWVKHMRSMRRGRKEVERLGGDREILTSTAEAGRALLLLLLLLSETTSIGEEPKRMSCDGEGGGSSFV